MVKTSRPPVMRRGRGVDQGDFSKLKAIFLDCDGIILESTKIKTRAFANLFKSEPTHVPDILDYHLRHAGVSRYRKFDYIYREILNQPLTKKKRTELAEQFGRYIRQAVLTCPLVPGMRVFLHRFHKRFHLYVVSGTPQAELRSILTRRGLSPFFRGVYGSPRDKTTIMGAILKNEGYYPREVLAVGDAREDLLAAQNHGVPFIGRVSPGSPNPFPSHLPRIKDITGCVRLLRERRVA